MLQPKLPSPIDVHVGTQIRMRRKSLGMSQSALAGRLGITFQQVQKYEKGANRVGASRLQAIASVLGVEVSSLFANATPDVGNANPALGSINAMQSFVASNEGFSLNQAFARIKNATVRKSIVALVTSLATTETAENTGAQENKSDD
ncbi:MULTISPECIES: helix-turn-helix domain-containing protein [Rhizobium]|jgi:transcriptional regulator with XRE-family HTH domain|uniref:Transcriptional regulator n=1 Tax=Rhizobium nepotum 39/7 TaxID=1368418 RepID=A0ABR5CW20_9HYPH|nr:helix-turn-helix transcriptional regulator [Rhizobium nepotum]KJF69030.1 transcriptional regulator [Rhizobium nepotum 39/7]